MNYPVNQAYRSQTVHPLTVTDPREASTESAPLSFTYFPHNSAPINAIKLTERRIEQRDVLTMYYPPKSITFTALPCQEALSYTRNDMIFNGGPEHEPGLHKPEYPTTQTHAEKGWHCHIKVAREQIPGFIRQLFLRHTPDSEQSKIHQRQFMRCVHILRNQPETRGLKFADGSRAENTECRDMTQSIAVDDRNFLQLC